MKRFSMQWILLSMFLFSGNHLRAAQYIDQWGFSGGRTGGWTLYRGNLSGDLSLSGTAPTAGWAAVRGEFPTLMPTADSDSALIIQGSIEFVGDGFNKGGNFRFGVFYSDSAGVLIQESTSDSNWIWTGGEDHHSGYLFIPPYHDDELVWWAGASKAGTHGAVIDGIWWDASGSQNYVLGKSRSLLSGTLPLDRSYSFALCIQPMDDGTREISFYLISISNEYYTYKLSIDSHNPLATEKFNCFALAVQSGEGSNLTGITLSDVKVEYGWGSLKPPGAKYIPFYLANWGFLKDRLGGWKFLPQPLIGNLSIAADLAPTGWAAIRGGFDTPVKPSYFEYIDEGRALKITGEMEWSGSDVLSAWHQLRLGIFQSDSSGSLIETPEDSAHWTGSENHHFGYVISPSAEGWDEDSSTCVGIVDGNWPVTPEEEMINPESMTQYFNHATPGPGIYHFGISIQQKADDSREIRFRLKSDDSSYVFACMWTDKSPELVDLTYNGFYIAIDSASQSNQFDLRDVMVEYNAPIEIPEFVNSAKPVEAEVPGTYALSPNYPNPFNGETMIQYQLPKKSSVKIQVYNIRGELVQILVDETQAAGIYSTHWDADRLASGIYFYRIQAGDFVKVNKCLMMK